MMRHEAPPLPSQTAYPHRMSVWQEWACGKKYLQQFQILGKPEKELVCLYSPFTAKVSDLLVNIQLQKNVWAQIWRTNWLHQLLHSISCQGTETMQKFYASLGHCFCSVPCRWWCWHPFLHHTVARSARTWCAGMACTQHIPKKCLAPCGAVGAVILCLEEISMGRGLKDQLHDCMD